MVVPPRPTEYNAYAAARSASGLAIAAATALLPITPLSIGSPFGLHPSLAELQTLVGSAEAVGRLQRRAAGAAADAAGLPGRRAAAVSAVLAFRSGRAVADVDRRSGRRRPGWGGRTADRFAPHASGFPMITALSGGIFTRGQTTIAALDCAGADGAEPGAGAERLRHQRRRSRRGATRWTRCARSTASRRSSPPPAGRRSRRWTSDGCSTPT